MRMTLYKNLQSARSSIGDGRAQLLLRPLVLPAGGESAPRFPLGCQCKGLKAAFLRANQGIVQRHDLAECSLLLVIFLLHAQLGVLSVATELDVDTLQGGVSLTRLLLDAEPVSLLVLIVRSMVLTLGHVCFNCM